MQSKDNNAITILAVDDSRQVLEMLEVALSSDSLRLMTAASGEAALALMAEEGVPDLATVDVNMPGGMDGFEFCKRLQRWSDVPVIMLTGVEEEETVVRAIEQYAEDYVTKPFLPGVLAARILRVVERVGRFPYPATVPVPVDEILSVNFPAREVYLDEQCQSLTPTESRLLHILMRGAGEIVASDYLLRRMWPREIVFEDRLHVYVHRLRSKLQRDGDDHSYIESERGVGYLFRARDKSEARR